MTTYQPDDTRHDLPAVPSFTPAPRRPFRKRHPVITWGGAALAALLALGIGVSATSGPRSFTATGTDEVCIDAPDITTGSVVTVTSSAGTVIGTGTLSSLATGLAGTMYQFTVPDLPSGEARYGITVGQNRGIVWFTPTEMTAGPGLSLGC